ncbi:divergent polysaccharide deacetylase family protein [Spiribacter halobius]|uniref:Divergent polysaccharide deacetylase family protein n=1 Tax=Sediminicurvatus halobius TaxID=2182432 RepID=A0A2U2N2G8_9GAMM|nr:divergent polysaccharide deacetylase family protein [Spiribacter halobius]PWG63425.1 divergent polysaccharide deacetylase family protein [Spiribacter halobius]UEX78096.1 divergent polysaccharide deacetylase family protein [Spiribacter halobius]
MARALTTLLLLATALPALAGEPRVALIIDDIGTDRAAAERTLALPVPLTLAILPHTPHARATAEAAPAAGKEVMLHQPMQAERPGPVGRGALWLDTTEGELHATLARNLEAVPNARGLNNHMGSLITRHPGHMAWLMEALAGHGDLYFVDSRTTHHTVARQIAGEHGRPFVERDVFLDHDADPAAIERQLARLVAEARREGQAVGIGHPRPNTLAVLERRLPALAREGIRFVRVSELIPEPEVEETPNEEIVQWSLPSSPSLPAARSLKPSP